MEKINKKYYYTVKSLMHDLNIEKTKAYELLKKIEKTPFAVATIHKTIKTKKGQNRKIPIKVINPQYYDIMINSKNNPDPIDIEIENEIEKLKYATKKDLLNEIKKKDYQIISLEEEIINLKNPTTIKDFLK